VENPYWQYFCGFDYLQHQLPIEPSSLTRWRERIGAERMEMLLKATIYAWTSAFFRLGPRPPGITACPPGFGTVTPWPRA
jgi:Transposase domain (DUF772)